MVARRACCLLAESAFWHDVSMHLDEEHTLSSLFTILSRFAFGLGAPVGLKTRRELRVVPCGDELTSRERDPRGGAASLEAGLSSATQPVRQ
jgi:hypothetical protein